jgi:hypothetical protein
VKTQPLLKYIDYKLIFNVHNPRNNDGTIIILTKTCSTNSLLLDVNTKLTYSPKQS